MVKMIARETGIDYILVKPDTKAVQVNKKKTHQERAERRDNQSLVEEPELVLRERR